MELVKNSPKVSQNSFVFILFKNVSKYFEKHTQGSHSHGKSWKILEKKWSWNVLEKSWKIAKIQNVMEICLPGKKVMEKSWKPVVQIRLIMFLNCVVINVDLDFIPQCL